MQGEVAQIETSVANNITHLCPQQSHTSPNGWNCLTCERVQVQAPDGRLNFLNFFSQNGEHGPNTKFITAKPTVRRTCIQLVYVSNIEKDIDRHRGINVFGSKNVKLLGAQPKDIEQ